MRVDSWRIQAEDMWLPLTIRGTTHKGREKKYSCDYHKKCNHVCPLAWKDREVCDFFFSKMENNQSCMACENERFIVYVDGMRAVFKNKVLIMMDRRR